MADAFTAGVEPGGLTSTQEIRILLCYMLDTVGQAINREEVTDILTAGGMANYFDIEDAIEELIRQQHLVEADKKIATTVTGAQIGQSLSVRIPYTLRQRSVEAALKLLKRIKIQRDNQVEITKLEEGGYAVTCTVQDRGMDLLTVTLRVADRNQADCIKEQFLNDPSLLFRSNLAVLTGDAGMRRAGTELVIKL
ncbi:MAG: DUF4364 family protein [Ruminococcaceae bacterium]|nr:DUF4364 family protein [Oscillospiraceae bacterium]